MIKTCHVQSEICDDAIPRFNCQRCEQPVCRRCCSRRLYEGRRRVVCNDCQIDLDGDDRRVRARIERIRDGFDGSAIDLEGRTVGALEVLRRHGTTPAGDVLWWARCECGEELAVKATLLYKGKKTSCGCESDAQPRHGKRGTRIYHMWQWLKQRGRLDEAWHEFKDFYEAVGDPPGDNMTLAPLYEGAKIGPQGYYWVVSRRLTTRNANAKAKKKSGRKSRGRARQGSQAGSRPGGRRGSSGAVPSAERV
jgi:hypothetical protein